MQAIKLKGIVDENLNLSLTLPPDTRAGIVEVVVLLSDETEVSKDSFTELMSFHKGRRLNGITLDDLRQIH